MQKMENLRHFLQSKKPFTQKILPEMYDDGSMLFRRPSWKWS